MMRLWHYALLPYLPDAQFKGQLRELVAIMRQWRDTGSTNHLLINRVMDYPKEHLATYFHEYNFWYNARTGNFVSKKYLEEFNDFCEYIIPPDISNAGGAPYLFDGWHNKEYLRVCMANLYEKHFFGKGKSRITGQEWQRLVDGYEQIAGEKYEL